MFVGHVRDITERLEGERAARQLAALVESSADAIVAVGLDGAVMSWNAGAERIYGYPREEALGRHIDELIVPPDRRGEMPEVGAELKSGGSVNDEVDPHAARRRASSRRGDGVADQRRRRARSAGISLIARDITGRREAERAVRRLAAIVESSSDAIYTFQLDGAVLSWNKGAERTLGYEAAEIAGRSVVILSNAGPDVRAGARVLRGAQAAGETVEREAMARRKDGAAINLAYTAFPIRDDHGALLAGGMIARDVTEQRRLEEQLRQAQKMEAVGQLAGGIAHDFNNLLTVITGYGQLARALVGDGRGRVRAGARSSARRERATELTRQLLAFSRRQRARPGRARPRGGRARAGADAAAADRRGHRGRAALADALPGVLADAGQLEQVVINLAVNARDAMPEGGRCWCEATRRRGRPRLAVGHRHRGRDRARGAPARLRAVLHDQAGRRRGPGSGWRRCTARSRSRAGTSRSTPSRATARRSSSCCRRPAERGAAVPERPAGEDWLGGDETILLCEDEDGVRALVELVLAGAGYRVLSEGRPNDALGARRGEPGQIHALVTDVIMPDMPGPELARRLGGTRPGLRTLFMSGYTADTVRERGSLPAGSAFLEKPFDRATLLRTLRELLDAAT